MFQVDSPDSEIEVRVVQVMLDKGEAELNNYINVA